MNEATASLQTGIDGEGALTGGPNAAAASPMYRAHLLTIVASHRQRPWASSAGPWAQVDPGKPRTAALPIHA